MTPHPVLTQLRADTDLSHSPESRCAPQEPTEQDLPARSKVQGCLNKPSPLLKFFSRPMLFCLRETLTPESSGLSGASESRLCKC